MFMIFDGKLKTMVLSPPKVGKSCFISKFRRMAPRPPTADLIHVKSTAFSAFASMTLTVTKQPTTSASRMLSKFLEHEIDEGADALASFNSY